MSPAGRSEMTGAGSEPLGFAELTELMQSIGRLPRYALHAHPSVIETLKATIGPSGERTAFDDLQLLFPVLLGIDVIAEQDWEGGRYELRKNGEIVLAGVFGG
jgi:hypothetical protein